MNADLPSIHEWRQMVRSCFPQALTDQQVGDALFALTAYPLKGSGYEGLAYYERQLAELSRRAGRDLDVGYALVDEDVERAMREARKEERG